MKKIYNFIHRHRYDITCLLVLILIILFVCIVFPKYETKNIVKIIENKTFDIRQNIIAKDKHVNKDIVIVTVDDPSYEYLIETYGDWPIPRHVYAQLLDYIQAQNPKYVAFDLLFIKSLNRIPQSDQQLVNAFEKYQNTYTAFNFDDYSFDLRQPPELDKKLSSEIKFESNKIYPIKFTNCRMIMNDIIDVTSNIGHINTPKSDDGFIRSIPVIVSYPEYEQESFKILNNNYYLYMTLKMAIDYFNKYENANITDLVVDNNNNLILGDRKIPLTPRGEVILNWYGESGLNNPNTFKYLSFWQVLKSIKAKEEGKKELVPEDYFKDKIVYIGTNVFSLSDIKTVPTGKYFPGVEMHATLFNNILDNNLIHKATLPTNIVISALLSILAIFTVFRFRSVFFSIIVYALIMVLFLYSATFVMTKYNLWIWIAVPVLSSMFTFVCSFIVKYLIKSRDFDYTYKLATTDGLTELYNHRYFQELLSNKIETSRKTGTKFSLIMTDIDFFKKFNDKYGHQAGDAVLKHVARTLKTNVRADDYVCRYGGEEMTIILNADKGNAIKSANKLCKAISSQEFELSPELSVNITISLGVSTFPEDGKTAAELIEYADKCLYKAKETGRNRVGNTDI
ncbi:diguanylate cyclase [bacterium]|nr:diguanylate cyclase [bacterium]